MTRKNWIISAALVLLLAKCECCLAELFGYVNAANRIVVAGRDVELIALEFKSGDSRLTPPNGPTEAIAAPFTLLMQNSPTHVSYGNLLSRHGTVTVDGRLELSVGFKLVEGEDDDLSGITALYADSSGTVREVTMTSPDCDDDQDINANDLACVSSIPQRDAVLSILDTYPGDLDGDRLIAFPDFIVLSTNFGQAVQRYVDGDIDLDGSVLFPDFIVQSTNFGRGVTAQSVPEPSTGLVFLIGLLVLSRRRVSVADRQRLILNESPRKITR